MELLVNYSFYVLYSLTLALALFKYPKYFDSVLKYFPIVIAYTLLTEILGWYILKYEDFQLIYLGNWYQHETNNAIVYNLFDIVFYSYFFYVYWKVIEKQKAKQIIKYSCIVFWCVCAMNIFIQDFRLFPQIYALVIGSSVLGYCIFCFFKELNDSEVPVKKTKNLLYWISVGLLLLYPLYTVFMIIGVYYNDLYYSGFNKLHKLLITIMYVCFIIGLVRMKRFRAI